METEDSNSDLKAYYLNGLVDPADHSFDNVFASNLSSIIEDRLLPYIEELFGRYTEPEFHEKMKRNYLHSNRLYNGFNFVGDWKRNHFFYWKAFIVYSRLNRGKVRFDKHSLLRKIIATFHVKGWQVYPHEIAGLSQTVDRIYNIMYYGKDL